MFESSMPDPIYCPVFKTFGFSGPVNTIFLLAHLNSSVTIMFTTGPVTTVFTSVTTLILKVTLSTEALQFNDPF